QRGLQDGEDIRADRDEFVDAGLLIFLPAVSRIAGQEKMLDAGRLQRGGERHRIGFIERVAAAQYRDPGAAVLERDGRGGGLLEAVIAQRLDAAGLEEILREG